MPAVTLQRCAVLLMVCPMALASAATGPIEAERSADLVLDSFDGGAALYQLSARGGAACKPTQRPGIARHGTSSLLLRIDAAPADRERHSVTLRWSFAQPQDWSAYAGMSLWVQCQGDPPPSLRPLLVEAGGPSYWANDTELAPRREGEWQLLELPFQRFTWCWEGPQDPNGRLDLRQVAAVSFEIRAEPGRAILLGLDGLGLYRPRSAYAGPVLRLRAPNNDSKLFVRAPGEGYRLVAELRQLPRGRQATVKVSGKDYWGQPVCERELQFTGQDGAVLRQELTFANPGPGYVGLLGTVSVDGRDVYRAEQGLACLAPADTQDTVPNERSIYGIWVNSDRRIGQQWDRIMVRYRAVQRLPDGRYQVDGCPPGVAAPSKWGWGDPQLNRIACFVDMPRWLSSHPERADYQKWSPTDWDQFAEMVRFLTRGAVQSGIRRFEVWNEPVPYAYWMGPMESIVKLHQVTYQAIKSVDPQARVLGPCPYTFLWEFLEDFFKAGGGRWIDDVVVHAYDAQPPDVNFTANLRRLRELMARYGLGDRELYITEFGYPTPRFTEQEQARYLVRSFNYAQAERVRVLVWHMLWDWSGTVDPEHYVGDPGYAIVRFERSPRPAYVAYGVLTRMLENARCLGPVSGLTGGQRGFRFERRGERIYTLWDTGAQLGTVQLAEPAASATRVDLMGGVQPLQPQRPGEYAVTVGADPCYLVAR